MNVQSTPANEGFRRGLTRDCSSQVPVVHPTRLVTRPPKTPTHTSRSLARAENDLSWPLTRPLWMGQAQFKPSYQMSRNQLQLHHRQVLPDAPSRALGKRHEQLLHLICHFRLRHPPLRPEAFWVGVNGRVSLRGVTLHRSNCLPRRQSFCAGQASVKAHLFRNEISVHIFATGRRLPW